MTKSLFVRITTERSGVRKLANSRQNAVVFFMKRSTEFVRPTPASDYNEYASTNRLFLPRLLQVRQVSDDVSEAFRGDDLGVIGHDRNHGVGSDVLGGEFSGRAVGELEVPGPGGLFGEDGGEFLAGFELEGGGSEAFSDVGGWI